jgi:hypothetical protein
MEEGETREEVVADQEQQSPVQLVAPIHPYGISVSTKTISNTVKYITESYIKGRKGYIIITLDNCTKVSLVLSNYLNYEVASFTIQEHVKMKIHPRQKFVPDS